MTPATNGANVRRDIIVIGASWGGVDALKRLVSTLPPGFPASLFAVIHMPANSTSVLPSLLSRAGPLPAHHARNGQAFRPGEIYLAPPDCHLLLDRNHMRLSGAARENRCRPAIDPLFRSAAEVHSERVVGVVLTGAQDDGTAGLLRIKGSGGIAIVQDPSDAFCADMPRSALAHVDIDYCLPLSAISTTLIALATAPSHARSAEVTATGQGAAMADNDNPDEPPSPFTCPDCHGTLWMNDGELVEFRCRVGHRYSVESMIEAQTDAVERAHWAALRALEEKAHLHRRLAARLRSGTSHIRFEETARDAEQQANVLRNLLVSNGQE
jgi:two-component system, chemotaxis family, protein-glutamate methylesterase/glutaminase